MYFVVMIRLFSGVLIVLLLWGLESINLPESCCYFFGTTKCYQNYLFGVVWGVVLRITLVLYCCGYIS